MYKKENGLIYKLALYLAIVVAPHATGPLWGLNLTNTEIIRATLYAIPVLFFYVICGEYVLNYSGINPEWLKVLGALYFLKLSYDMLFQPSTESQKRGTLFFPWVIPVLAGPSALLGLALAGEIVPEVTRTTLLLGVFLCGIMSGVIALVWKKYIPQSWVKVLSIVVAVEMALVSIYILLTTNLIMVF